MKTHFYSLLFIFSAHLVFGQDVQKAIGLYETNKLTEASKILRTIGENSPKYEKSQFYLGRIAFDNEDFVQAQEFFEEVVELNGNSSEYQYWLGNAMGRLAQESNFFKQGILAPQIKSAYERSVELDPKNIDASWGLVEYYTLAPGVMGGSWEKAEKTARAIYVLDKLQGHNALATVYLRQEKFSLAEQEYIKASKLDQRFVFTLGYFYQNQKTFNKAFEVFENEVRKNPENIAALYQIGRTSALSGERPDLGIRSLNEYLNQPINDDIPSHSAALMRKGMIYEKIGETTKAKTYYSQSLAKDSEMNLAKEGLDRLSK
jgi:tetratricopeptide (TPR) repeat protein